MIAYRFQSIFKLRFNLTRLVLPYAYHVKMLRHRGLQQRKLFHKTVEHTSHSHLPDGQALGGIDEIKKLGSLGCGEHEECEECRQHGER